MAKRKAPKIKPELDPESEAWNKIPWRKLEKQCFRIQKRIFRASQRGNTRAVHKLQKLLMKSQSARLLSVRRVTQDNQGKKTAGIDGIKSVKPAERQVMAKQIHPKNWKETSPPVRRVWIPKPGKTEKRPLAACRRKRRSSYERGDHWQQRLISGTRSRQNGEGDGNRVRGKRTRQPSCKGNKSHYQSVGWKTSVTLSIRSLGRSTQSFSNWSDRVVKATPGIRYESA